MSLQRLAVSDAFERCVGVFGVCVEDDTLSLTVSTSTNTCHEPSALNQLYLYCVRYGEYLQNSTPSKYNAVLLVDLTLQVNFNPSLFFGFPPGTQLASL